MKLHTKTQSCGHNLKEICVSLPLCDYTQDKDNEALFNVASFVTTTLSHRTVYFVD